MLYKIHNNHWLYIIEPPRTGSSSMRWALNKAFHPQIGNDPHPRRHNRACEILPIVREKCKGELTVATLARHPAIRAWSLKKWWIANHGGTNTSYAKILESTRSIDDTWRRHFKPCAWYAWGTMPTQPYEFVLHTETLNEDAQALAKELAFQLPPVPHHNAFLTRAPYPQINSSDWYTIREHYERDFLHFGYDASRQPDWARPKSNRTINPYSGL